MDIRQKVWESLDNYIQGLPRRHKLVIMGDFNSQLSYEPPLVGRGLKPSPAHDRSDKAKFQGIIRRHQLTAVNTFGTKCNAATFISEQGSSQIDYILARQNTCACHMRPSPDGAEGVGTVLLRLAFRPPPSTSREHTPSCPLLLLTLHHLSK